MPDARATLAKSGPRRRTLLPGKLLPILGLAGTAVGWGGAVLIEVKLGARGEGLGSRLAGAEILVAMGWFLCRAGSQRIVLDEHEMRIYTSGLCWRVPRGCVHEVEVRLRDSLSLVVVLTDAYRIRPTTFATQSGIGQFNPKALGRSGIREAVMAWNGDVLPDPSEFRGARGRYWSIRTDDLPVVAAMALIVAIVALAS